MKEKLVLIKVGNVGYEKTLWFRAKKLSRFGTRKFPRQARDDQIKSAQKTL